MDVDTEVDDVHATRDVPEEWDHVPEEVKNKIWQTIMRWKGFKTVLTSRYIHGKLSGKNPCEIYKFLDEETWGYDRLEEIMIREASSLAIGDQSYLISPPPRHEKQKRARTKPSREYTSEETRLVAEKIDDLVKKRSKGSFTQEGRDDIFAVAIARPEHPGYIRGVG
ncbi:hypothetical protein V8G54_003658 [Vigna mungo]|uniref:Transposase n=1 Tax=Vigna mungo TaxID=3915 RepID=A0AAQ3SED1_VIGMU